MATTTGTSQLFEWLTEERLVTVAAKLRQLPTGSEFERCVESGIREIVGIEDRTYSAIVDEHGDLVGYADPDKEQLPWWLADFEWTITAEPLDSLTISGNSLEQFEDYPLDSTKVESISLSSADAVIEGLDAFAELEETLTNALEDPNDYALDGNSQTYELPEKLFVVPDRGRIDTSESFKKWFEHLINLCPPGCPELTALLRVNTNVQRQHMEQVLGDEAIERLTSLSIIKTNDPTARSFNDAYHDSLTTLLQIEPPFDLEFEVDNNTRYLTDLRYAYYRGWAQDTERLSNEQKWLRKARNRDNIEESEEYRFAEYAFQLPIRISKSNVVFEDQETYGSSNKCEAIADILEEFGHPVNDD